MTCHTWPAVSSCPAGAVPLRGSWPYGTLGQGHHSTPGPPNAGPPWFPCARSSGRSAHLSLEPALHGWSVGLMSSLVPVAGGTQEADPSSAGLCVLIWDLKLVWQLQVSSCACWKAAKFCIAGASVLDRELEWDVKQRYAHYCCQGILRCGDTTGKPRSRWGISANPLMSREVLPGVRQVDA